MSRKVGRVKQPERKPDPAGPTVRTTATVAPSTVEAMGQAAGKRRRRPNALDRPRTSRVQVTKVHPLAWQAAQAVLGTHGYSRVEVESPTQVVVR